jgi:hypothetical protein
MKKILLLIIVLVSIKSSFGQTVLNLYNGVNKYDSNYVSRFTSIGARAIVDKNYVDSLRNKSRDSAVALFTGNVYRTTNGGSNVTPQIFAGNSTITAGTLAVGLDNTNMLTFNAANGTRQIARAGITLSILDNTAGSEAGALAFYTKPTGSAMTQKMTLTSDGNLSLSSGGAFLLAGSSSGVVTINTAAAAGTWTLTLPADSGTDGYFLKTDGNGVTSWVAGSGSGTVTSFAATDGNGFDFSVANASTTPTLTATTTVTNTRVMYSNSGAITGAAGMTFDGTAGLTLGAAGSSLGLLKLTGNTSGTVTINTAAAAGTWTLQLPANDGDADQFLQTNGSGVTSWVAGPTSVTGTGNQVLVNGTSGSAQTGAITLTLPQSINTTANVTFNDIQVSSITASTYVRTAGFQPSYNAESGTYTALGTDHTIDCTSGTFTVSLPSAAGMQGHIYVIKNSGAGSITVDPNGVQTVDGASTYTLGTQYKYVTIQSTGSNWIVIANN